MEQHKPLVFLENKGQVKDQYGHSRSDIDFKATTTGMQVFVGAGALHYQWTKVLSAPAMVRGKAGVLPQPTSEPLRMSTYRMDVQLLGANEQSQPVKTGKMSYYERYYLGDTKVQQANAYEQVTYKDIYPGIDWVLYAKGGKVEYRFIVHPGAKVSDIQIQYNGADSSAINPDGSLSSYTPYGFLTEAAPYSFDDKGQTVTSAFNLQNNILQFRVNPYNGTLTIDPTLSWGTYYGGDGGILDASFGGVFDSVNKDGVYICGWTSSGNIATIGAYQEEFAGSMDAYIAKFTDAGILQWGTYYGGEATDGQESKLTIDNAGDVYLTGITYSATGIATPGSFQENYVEGSDNFLAKFDSNGVLQWATYYGGGFEWYPDVVTDGYNVYLFSASNSPTGIASDGAYQTDLTSNGQDWYLAKFDPVGNRIWGTYYGADGGLCESAGIVYDTSGFLYLTGWSTAPGLATSGAYQETNAGDGDMILAKFDTSGNPVWTTYYGGEGEERAYDHMITLDKASNVYITGTTGSATSIATESSQQEALGGGGDAFIAKFDSEGDRVWATYYGGEGDETAGSICYGNGQVYAGGSTLSISGMATAGAYQTTNNATNGFIGNIFLVAFDTASGLRDWGTYYGGNSGEGVSGICYDPAGWLYVIGATTSASGITTPGSWEENNPGAIYISFLSKFCLTPAPSAIALSGDDTVCANGTATYTVAPVADADAYIWNLPAGWQGSSDGNEMVAITNTIGGNVSVQVVRCGDTSDAKILPVYVLPAEPPVITVNGFQLGTVGTYNSYQWLLNGSSIDGATGATYTVTENGDYTVVTVNAYGCTDTSAPYSVTNATGVAVIPAASDIRVYPNPVSGMVYIDAPLVVNLALYGIDGRELLHKDRAQFLNLSGLAKGVYMLRIMNKDGLLIKATKLVKF